MSAPPFMQLYVADYLGDTRHLTTEQHGAYLLLLMAMWRAGGELPNDTAKLGRIVGLSAVRWRKIAVDVLAFFKDEGERLTHGRVTAELQKAQRTSDARSEAGTRGAQAKALKTQEPVEAIAVVLPEPASSPAQALQTSEPEKSSDADASVVRRKRSDVQIWDDVFAAGWEAYPRSGRVRSWSKPKLWPVWREAAIQAGGPERLLGAVRRYATDDKGHKGECGAPAFEKWLKTGRWEHYLEGPAAVRHMQPFPDVEIRNAVVSAKSEAWTASWLDPCSWEPERRLIIPRTGLAAKTLRAEVFRVLEARKASIQELAA